ncbi:uncharacterized protein MAM_03024 [Metarhizium album ARSEF 1941]|uniref:Uncharacterized protein n=1 Tax=Metarhizium album (strain ARSEF 1941) TaxID=1081103 RepID=A0A0B2WTD7_METAS|nr:uncharacterized protein MAM_03024 [Metarhizium album ARSEF 1941]KHN99326.1 hypothetical protein MAM_03024 [Metarhizium album ARSEF 1941]
MRTSQLLGLVAALATSAAANPVPQTTTAEAARPSSCTSTMIVFPTMTSGPVRTTWTATTTVTQYLDCGGCCKLKRERFPMGPGPAIFFTTTETMATPTTTTVFACATSA